MSYNISLWTTKKLRDLVIPLDAFYEHRRADWHPASPELIEAETNLVELVCGCGQTIRGTLKDRLLSVSEFDMNGEGSGTFYSWILEPALRKSTGELDAVLIWENGDSVQRLKVKDGIVSTEEIDL